MNKCIIKVLQIIRKFKSIKSASPVTQKNLQTSSGVDKAVKRNIELPFNRLGFLRKKIEAIISEKIIGSRESKQGQTTV